MDAPWQEGAVSPQINHEPKEPGGPVETRTSGPAPSDLPEQNGILEHVVMIQRERRDQLHVDAVLRERRAVLLAVLIPRL